MPTKKVLEFFVVTRNSIYKVLMLFPDDSPARIFLTMLGSRSPLPRAPRTDDASLEVDHLVLTSGSGLIFTRKPPDASQSPPGATERKKARFDGTSFITALARTPEIAQAIHATVDCLPWDPRWHEESRSTWNMIQKSPGRSVVLSSSDPFGRNPNEEALQRMQDTLADE